MRLMLTIFLLVLPATAMAGNCVVGGCGTPLCYEEGTEPAIGNCMARADAYCFYEKSKCERQPDGACGWTETDELRQCTEAANRPPVGMPGPQHKE